MIRDLLAKKAVIKSNLGFTYRDRDKNKWFLAGEHLIAAAESVAAAYCSARSEGAGLGSGVLKRTERRLIFKFTSQMSGQEQHFVAKTFLLNIMRHRIKSYRYGLNEASNLLTAFQCGISVPQLYGYGIRYGGWGLPVANFLLLEYLSDYKSVGTALEESAGDEKECRAILMRTVPVFVSLYRAGCNHIDLHRGAIMLHGNNREPPRLLDLHYARFHNAPNLEVLAFEMGYFSKCCSQWLAKDAFEEWMIEIFRQIQLDDDDARRTMKERIRTYTKIIKSRKQRIAIA